MSFEEDLAAASGNPRETAEVEFVLGENLHTLRFTQMEGLDWAAESDKHPARIGVLIDSRYGYNIRTLIKAVAPKCGVRVTDEGVTGLTDEQWVALFKALPGSTFQRITDAIWQLNEWAPAQAVEAAKKARAGSPKIAG